MTDGRRARPGWTTNPDGDSVVFYGTTSGNYPNSVSDPTSTTTHSVTLKNLEPATQYFYKVQSRNAGGTMPLSSEATFTTLPPTAPAISNVAVPNINKSEATITWSTTPSGTSQVKYGTTSGSYPNQTTPDTTRNTSHTVSLTALSPGTKYYFIVLSGNAGGSSTSLESNFTTLPDPPPPPVGGSSLVGTFTDGFTSYDPSKWTFSTSAAGDSADDYAGVLRLTPAASTGTAAVNVDSLAQWSLIGSSVSVGVLQVVANNGGVNCKFNFHVPGAQAFNQTLGFWYEWGNLYAYYYVDGVQYSAAALTYSPVNHAWWRLRENSGTIFWDTSADGVNWGAPVAQIPTSTLHFDLTHGIVGFNVKAYGSGNSSPGSAQFANLNLAPAPLSTLLDPLLCVNTNLWYVEQDTPGSTVTVGNGVASLSPEPGSGIGGSGLIGVKTYSLTGSSISVRVPQVVTNGPNVDQILRIAPGPFDFKRSVGFWYQQGILSAYQEVNENPTAVATLTYSPTTHAYWRIRESAGTVYWDTSSNGTTWTTQGTAPVSGLSFSPSSVSVYFTAKEWATGNANPGTGQFSKLNQ